MKEVDEFNPKKAELLHAVEIYKHLTITGVDDVKGLEAVHNARMVLQKFRTFIKRTGEGLRAEAVAKQKAVIERVKEFTAIIEPLEKQLHEQEKAIDREKVLIRRKDLMPDREEKLRTVEAEYSYDEVLELNDGDFNTLFNEKKAEFLQRKEDAMKVQRVEDEEKAQVERDRVAQEQAKKNEEITAKEAKLTAEADRLKAEEQRIERETTQKKTAEETAEQNKKIIKVATELAAEQERERIEREAREAKEKTAKEKDRLEKLALYQDFLKIHGYTEETKENFMITTMGSSPNHKIITLYKKIGEITIK